MNQRRPSWSLEVGAVAQIPIRIHVTFLLLLLWLVFGVDTPSPVIEGLFVVAVFLCVLLHELGHALVAKRFGVQTRDITLYPFGGVASIGSQPSAKGELAIALAGPLVNIVIALALYPWITLPDLTKPEAASISFPVRLFLTNIGLAVFNLLPALPMDGGRVLRATLTLLGLKKPTTVAARVSQALCILLAIAALVTKQPMLFVIAFIVFFGAMQEQVRTETKVIAHGFRVADATIPRERLESFTHGTTVSKALSTALTSLQPLYPIVRGDELLGVIFREDILEHAATHADAYVGEIITRALPSVDENASLDDALTALEQSNVHVASVTRSGEYVGLLVYDRLADFLLLHEIRQKLPKDDDTEWSMPL